MKTTPYSNLPPHAYWRSAVAEVAEIDPVVDPPFRFSAREKIMAAGSCFAQHIGRYLKSSGCAYLITETPHAFLSETAAAALNYEIYTARYGNIYSSRQLLQLIDRAYGRFTPRENYWSDASGAVIDPFRPQIQPNGFGSIRELDLDRERHFAAVREAFETLDIFIFTLGLTETWRSREDKAIFPLCPGVAGGAYSAKAHEFVNLGVEDVISDMRAFFERLRSVNARARMILTVSPVPLVATAERRHVIVSTMVSKSILRVACDALTRENGAIAYFPSYEIVAGGYAGRDYFAADRRSVTPEGVAHVMRVFDRHFIKRNIAEEALRRTVRALTPGKIAQRDDPIAAAMQVMCDEEALELQSLNATQEEAGDSATENENPQERA